MQHQTGIASCSTIQQTNIVKIVRSMLNVTSGMGVRGSVQFYHKQDDISGTYSASEVRQIK